MHYVSLVTVLLCIGAKIGGSTVTERFVKTGSDVTLDIMNPADLKEKYFVLQWKFNKDTVLVSAPPYKNVTVNNKTVVFHSQNSSVTLKNIQKKHSGLYEAQIIKEDGQPVISAYSVSVWDPVSPVTVTVDSVSNSSESCNFTVSCSTKDSNISHSFTCNKQKCDHQDTTTPSGAHLNIYLSNQLIICNHSNHVSWTYDTTETICPLTGDGNKGKQHQNGNIWTILGPIIGVAVAVAVGIAGWIYKKKCMRSVRVNMENTVYEVIDTSSAPKPAPTEVLDSPTSMYSLVGPHSGPAPTTVTRDAPESLYATVDKAPRP